MLVLSRKHNEGVYVFGQEGNYLKMVLLNKARAKIGFDDSTNHYKILREEIVQSMGGLESVVRQIREGKFKFHEGNRGDETC